LGVEDLSWASKTAIPISKLAKEKEKLVTISKDDLRLAFRTVGVLRRAITLLGDLETARGFELVHSSEEVKTCIETFIKNTKKNSHFGWDLSSYMRSLSINTDVFGNGFTALLPNGSNSKYVGLQPLSSIITDFKRDSMDDILFDNGKPAGYVFKDDNTAQTVDINVPVAHNVFVNLGDDLLGYSLIESCYNQVERMMEIEHGTAQAILKFGSPFLDITVKSTSNFDPDNDSVDEINSEIQEISQGSGYVHPEWQDVQFQNPVFPRGVTEFVQNLLDSIVTSTGIPKHLLVGQGQLITKATAESLQRMLNPFLEPRQRILARTVENHIFARVLEKEEIDGSTRIDWNEIMPETNDRMPERIKIMSETTIEGKSIISYEEAREMLGFSSEQNQAKVKDTDKKIITRFM